MRRLLSVFALSPFRIGGQESFARELSSQIGRCGWESILCFSSEPSPVVRRYLELPNVSFEVLENPEHVTGRSIANLVRILRRYRPKILHLHYTGFIGPYPWLAQLCSVPQIFFTDHGIRPAFYFPRRAPLWKRSLARWINWPISCVICVSDYGYRSLVALDLLPADRFVTIYNAVDFNRVSELAPPANDFRRKYSIPGNRSVVVQVSWIIPEKGIVSFLEAARLILERNPNVHFVLVGEGDYREEYTRLSVAMGLEDHLTWTGLVEDPFAEGVYATADVVCQLTNCEELFGYAIAEAMACNRPVVATQVGGIPELVRDGETGFLVPRGDATQIAEKILLLLGDTALRGKMGRSGRRLAQEKFNVEHNVSQLLRLYRVC